MFLLPKVYPKPKQAIHSPNRKTIKNSVAVEDKLRYILWEEAEYTEEKRAYIRSLAYDIRSTFKQAGVDNILINTKGTYRIDTQKNRI